jgi:gliding motility-associated-like protein
MTLTIISNPLLSSALEDSIFICEGEDFTASPQVIGGIEPYQYTWTNGTGGVWSTEELTLTGNTTTTYYLQLQDACEYEYEDSVVVVVPNYDPVEISSTFSNTITMCQDDDLHLDVDITGGTGTYVYEWRKDNIPISGEEILVVQDQDVSENDYLLTVTDECGTTAVKEFTIRVDHCQVPNIFTPNGDGLNDFFYFKSKDVEVNIRVRIMDRWGHLVYRNENYEHCNLGGIDCWNGKNYISDKECEEGIYFYVIEYNDGRLLKGTFHLMR